MTDFYSGEAAPDAEVTIVVTDQAILDLLPYPLPVSDSTLLHSPYCVPLADTLKPAVCE